MTKSLKSDSTRPVGLYDAEPLGILFDINGKLKPEKEQFRPFESMIKLSQTENEFREILQNYNYKKIFALLLISDLNDQPFLDQLLQTCLIPADFISSIYLLFPNPCVFHEKYSSMLKTKFGWCRSYQNETYFDYVHDVGRIICHERITFYERKRVEYEYDLNNNTGLTARSMLEQVAQLKRDHAMLLSEYLQVLAQKIDED